jgi:hypothetical protein
VFEVADSTDLAMRLAWLSGANIKVVSQEMQLPALAVAA